VGTGRVRSMGVLLGLCKVYQGMANSEEGFFDELVGWKVVHLDVCVWMR